MAGELNDKLGAGSWGGVAVEAAPMIIDDDLVANGEAHAGALVDGFGGKKGIENLAGSRFRDAGAGICDRNSDPIWLLNFGT